MSSTHPTKCDSTNAKSHKLYRKREAVHLLPEQRRELNRLITSGQSSARTLTRARILLMLDPAEGRKRTDEQIAEALMCDRNTVRNIRNRFLDGGLEAALTEKPRPGASLRPKITGEVEAQLTLLACSKPPEGHSRWSLSLFADRLVELKVVESISAVAVGNCLKKRAKTLAGR